mmetsp:Transcript_21829/g.66252  ORF Transcript_21829/g.66252 Transcript_21829/m.66252 type:complete len:260 (+) Transcript_21829:266-1045(+)
MLILIARAPRPHHLSSRTMVRAASCRPTRAFCRIRAPKVDSALPANLTQAAYFPLALDRILLDVPASLPSKFVKSPHQRVAFKARFAQPMAAHPPRSTEGQSLRQALMVLLREIQQLRRSTTPARLLRKRVALRHRHRRSARVHTSIRVRLLPLVIRMLIRSLPRALARSLSLRFGFKQTPQTAACTTITERRWRPPGSARACSVPMPLRVCSCFRRTVRRKPRREHAVILPVDQLPPRHVLLPSCSRRLCPARLCLLE